MGMGLLTRQAQIRQSPVTMRDERLRKRSVRAVFGPPGIIPKTLVVAITKVPNAERPGRVPGTLDLV